MLKSNHFPLLAYFPYLESTEQAYEITLLSVRVCVYPLSLLGNGSVKITLSLLRNGSVKIPLSLLGNGSIETLPP
jgi:hypothetical protein